MKLRIFRLAGLIASAALIASLMSCSKTPKWFVGRYEFDAAQSMKPLTEKSGDSKTRDVKKDGNMIDAVKGLATVLAPFALIKQFEGAMITITYSEIITTKGGSGTVVKFEVYQTPDADSVMLKTSENKIETWIRTPTGIAQKASGDLDILIPFKRKAL